MSSPTSQISVLLALINDAAKAVETQFLNSSKPMVPTLDDTTPHPLDTEITPTELRKSIQTLEGACAQLCAIAAPPNQSVLNKTLAGYEPACLNVAATFKIPDILQGKPSGMHIDELAQKSGVDADKLRRVLRYLTTKHVFRETTPNVFTNNRLSLELLSTNPMSQLVNFTAEESNGALTALASALGDPAWRSSDKNNQTAYNKWRKSSQSLWEYYDAEGKEFGARFGIGLSAWNNASQSHAVVKDFPWGDLRDGASVCDVGGGIGPITMQLAKAYPNLRLKLQDLPARIDEAKTDFWPKECPEAIKENRIEFKPIDFLTETPIRDCDVYYVKNVMFVMAKVKMKSRRYILRRHNWSDGEAAGILRNIRNGMAPHSRLLLQEYIIHPAYRVPDTESQIVQAPEPLLANYGAGKIRGFTLDIAMMALLNSRERTLEEHIKLAREAGLEFVKFWSVGETVLLEYKIG